MFNFYQYFQLLKAISHREINKYKNAGTPRDVDLQNLIGVSRDFSRHFLYTDNNVSLSDFFSQDSDWHCHGTVNIYVKIFGHQLCTFENVRFSQVNRQFEFRHFALENGVPLYGKLEEIRGTGVADGILKGLVKFLNKRFDYDNFLFRLDMVRGEGGCTRYRRFLERLGAAPMGDDRMILHRDTILAYRYQARHR